MSSFGDGMSDAIKRRIDKAGDTTVAAGAPLDAKTRERLASEEAQRKAYEARQKAGK